VRIGSHSSPPNLCSVGVSQGSVLGPLLFSLYTPPISTIANSHQVSQQQYADDTQLYVALLPANYSQDISALESCLNSLRIWFCENGEVKSSQVVSLKILWRSSTCRQILLTFAWMPGGFCCELLAYWLLLWVLYVWSILDRCIVHM